MDPASDDTRHPSRRTLLCGAGLTAVGLLAACGHDAAHAAKAGGAPTSGGGVGGGSASAGSGSGGGASGGAANGGSGSGGGAALARTADVPVGGGEVVGPVLIVQPVAGTFKAYDAACPHKGVLVKPPVNGIVTCPAHGSTFRAADGSRVSGPATRGLTEIAVTVDGASIVKR